MAQSLVGRGHRTRAARLGGGPGAVEFVGGRATQVAANLLAGRPWTTNVDPWGIIRGGLYGMVSGAVAGLWAGR